MAIIRSEKEVERIIEELMQKGNGKYITQSVLFKKDNPYEIEMLKKVLMRSTSFGGYVRKVLANELKHEN